MTFTLKICLNEKCLTVMESTLKVCPRCGTKRPRLLGLKDIKRMQRSLTTPSTR